MQDIYRLEAFVAVVEEGSLAAAIHRLHITQPALSARLKLLEESFGCDLLERSGRGVRPTPMGHLVYKQSLEVLKRMSQLEVMVQSHLTLKEGRVVVGGGATAVMGVFPEVVQAFSQLFPNVRFTVQEDDSRSILSGLREGLIDIGIVTRSPEVDLVSDEALHGFTIHEEYTDKLVVVASKENALAKPGDERQKSSGLTASVLSDKDFVLFEDGSAIRKIINKEFERLGLNPRVIMTLRSVPGMLRMVEKNVGLSVVSLLSTLHNDRVKVLNIKELSITRSLLVLTSSERTLPPAAAGFLGVLVEFVKNLK